MEEHIVIGTDREPTFNGHACWYKAKISIHGNFYVINCDFPVNGHFVSLPTVYIFMHSDEGKEVDEWLNSGEEIKGDAEVINMGLKYLMPKLSPDHLRRAFEEYGKRCYESGGRDAKKLIRKALGME